MESVKLYAAYEWKCPNCNIFQFETGIYQELTPEEKDQISSEQGVVREDLDTDLIVAPEGVKCNKCGREFKTEYPLPRQDDWDEDDDWGNEDWSERDEDYN